MFSAIGKFQKSQDLPVTKVIRPGDKTSAALEKLSEDEGDDYAGGNYKCPECDGFHGGSAPPGNDYCPECIEKGIGPGITWEDEEEES